MIEPSGCRDRQRRWLVSGLLSLAATALAVTISLPVARADDSDDGLNALIMGGTGMPTPGSQWVDSMITDYINPATGNSYNPVVVTTPEALPVDHTVAEGLTDLQTAMAAQQAGRPWRTVCNRGIFAERIDRCR